MSKNLPPFYRQILERVIALDRREGLPSDEERFETMAVLLRRELAEREKAKKKN